MSNNSNVTPPSSTGGSLSSSWAATNHFLQHVFTSPNTTPENSLRGGTAFLNAFPPPANESEFTFKAAFREEIARFKFLSSQTLSDLVAEVRSAFGHIITSEQHIALKYKDEEGDFISLVRDSDLAECLLVGRSANNRCSIAVAISSS